MRKRCVTMRKITARDYLRIMRENYGTINYCAETCGFKSSDFGNIEAGVENDIRVIANTFFLFSRRFGLNYYELMMMEAKFQLGDEPPKTKPKATVSFAELLKKTRTQAGISQAKLADTICCTKFTVYTWESGEKLPDLEMLERICYALKVPVDFFDAVYKAERFQPRTPRERKKKE